MVVSDITREIKSEAERLGFSACGIAKAEPVDEAVANKYRRWLEEGKNATMAYLQNNLEKRLNPLLLMPEARSIISLALNYYPERKLGDDQYQFAYYAYGQDYHDVIKAKLQELASYVRTLVDSTMTVKLCVDTVPMLDRYWAWKAGLGWIGKNTNLIIPRAGSFFFLAELIVDIDLEYDSPMESHCGTCTRCVDACPTGALESPYSIDANKCLSYLTIEHRGDFDSDILSHKSETAKDEADHSAPFVYGCDRCQLACPYNRFAQPTKIKEFTPKDEFLNMRPSDWQSLTVEQYRTLSKGSAVKRAKYEGLVRNISMVKDEGN